MPRYALAPLALLVVLGLALAALTLVPTAAAPVDVTRLANWMLGVNG